MGKQILSKELGQIGEDCVCEYLAALDYEILDRNYRCKYGEIDIVAWQVGEFGVKELVFVEVKARRNAVFGQGVESINYYKRLHLLKSAQTYLIEKEICLKSWRIDLISVKLGIDLKLKQIQHLKNILNG